MSLYLKPPRGLVNLHTFQDCVEQRLKCYNSINKENELFVHNFEYLVEDSPLDRTGHYLFRLLAYCDKTFERTFLKNEKKLLFLRLNYYSKEDLKYFLKKILRHSKECLIEDVIDDTMKEMYNLFTQICSFMLCAENLNHIFKDDHTDFECDKFVLKVPFHLCACLVVHREINLNKGLAEIRCSDWKRLFLSTYETYLRRAINEMKYSQNVQVTVNDDRVKNIFKFICNDWFDNGIEVGNEPRVKFNITNIETQSKYFPLCMLNLYKVLQRTNRLSHNERFDFSLYLKGIGMSLSDSLKFWENAYSKQHSSCSKCSHNWKDNEKRYSYGIRHLYGLEGSRKSYTVGTCEYYQKKTLSAVEYGGCPFQHFDENNLRQVLKKLLPGKEDDIEVMIYERRENPTESCKLFYENILKITTNNSNIGESSFNNPVEYYLSLQKSISTNTNGKHIESDSGIAV